MAKLMGTWARPGLLLARNRHGGTVTFREMHSLPVVTRPVRGHKPAEVTLDSNQFSSPAWSLLFPEHCFPGFSRPSFFPRYTVLGAAASREPQVPRMVRGKSREQLLSLTFFTRAEERPAHRHSRHCVPLCHTPGRTWGHGGDQNRVPALGCLLRRH